MENLKLKELVKLNTFNQARPKKSVTRFTKIFNDDLWFLLIKTERHVREIVTGIKNSIISEDIFIHSK